MSWKLCYVHNFSPHEDKLWDNGNNVKKNKSIYREYRIERGIIFLRDLFDDRGKLYSYEEFLNDQSFPVKYNKYASVMSYQNVTVQRNCLKLCGIEIANIKCTNKHIRKEIQKSCKISPKGKFF